MRFLVHQHWMKELFPIFLVSKHQTSNRQNAHVPTVVRIYVVYDACMHIQKLAVSPSSWPLLPASGVTLNMIGVFTRTINDCSVMAVLLPD